MIHFLTWYLLITLLGWLVLPLAWRLFPALADRGFTLARAFGLLLWSYIFWMLASLGIIRNDGGGLGLAFLLVAGLSVGSLWKSSSPGLQPIRAWLRSKSRMVITVEVIFFLSFAVWAFVRACNPAIETAGGEKTMELAFINAILNSPTFPPHDPWLSGYAISYYYFGYVMTAMLAKATATSAGVAHNLMLALVFALSFIGSYGLLYNLLSAWRNRRGVENNGNLPLGLPFLGPLFLLFISNVAGFLEILHRRGVGWGGTQGGDNLWTVLGRLVRPNLQANNFWTWLDIQHLNVPPSQPYQWVPDRFIWWWQDSRVVQDYDLAGSFTEIIDEFPAFSYLLGDLHPHVLGMPFGLMAVAFALNLFLGGWKGSTGIGSYRLPVSWMHFLSAALLLGGLAFLNTWDILVGFALLAGAYVLTRIREAGWRWKRLLDLLAFGIPLGILAILIYFPFYIGFSSQAGGILPNLEYPTRGAHLWVMFGTLFLPIFSFLAYLWSSRRYTADRKTGLGLTLGLVLFLWLFSLLLMILVQWKMPQFAADYILAQGFTSVSSFLGATFLRRLAFSGGLITLLAIFIPTISYLAAMDREHEVEEIQRVAQKNDDPQNGSVKPFKTTVNFRFPVSADPPLVFILFILFLGAMLVLAPDFVYLRDLFGKRMNTIFKFYYQAWLLWSLAAGFGIALLLDELRRFWKWALRIALIFLLVVGMAFPLMSLPSKTNDFQIQAFRSGYAFARASGDPNPLRSAANHAWTLDGTRLFHDQYPDDAAAADWLAAASPGVVAEAVGGSYTNFARISTYSGQPAVVGWIGHEDQWRGTFDEQRRRGEQDIPLLYQTNDWEAAQAIIQKYDIRYVVVGTLERILYRVYENNLQQYLVPVFQSGEVVVYQVP